LSKRMQAIQHDIFALVTRLNGLHTFIHYHMGYIELYKTAAHLQETYGQARVHQRSQTDLLTYVRANSSVFTAYPYFDFVEKAERAMNTLKSHLHAASYAQSTDLVHDAQELLNDLIVIKGTLASTHEYRDDVHKREVARIQREKEAAELARIQAEQQRDEMAALAAKAQAEAERVRIYAEQQRAALERQKLEEQRKAQHKKEHAIQQQKVELERAQLAAQQDAVRHERERLERERAAAAQQAQYDAWHRAREASYQQQMPQPSAPPAEEPTYNYGNNLPEPSAPPADEEEDLDAVFAKMDKELKFETQETEQFQEDHGIEDVD
jgi:chromosome segregation ATPase